MLAETSSEFGGIDMTYVHRGTCKECGDETWAEVCDNCGAEDPNQDMMISLYIDGVQATFNFCTLECLHNFVSTRKTFDDYKSIDGVENDAD